MIAEEKNKININDDNESNKFFEENKKLLEEIKQEKYKNESQNNINKINNLNDKNSILEEKIKSLLEEKNIKEELIQQKNKQIEADNLKIKNMEDKLFDINQFIKTKCKNDSFVKKINSICNIENLN